MALVLILVGVGCSSGSDRGDRSGGSGRTSTTERPRSGGNGGSADGPVATVLTATTVAAARAGGVSTTIPQECGPLTAADVADAVGVAEGDVRSGTEDVPDAPCVFRAATFEVATAAAVQESTTTMQPVPLPSVPGLPGHNYLTVERERGGRWTAQAGALVGRTFVSLTVRNDRAGSDTYPPADGPAQEGPTRELATSLLTVLAARI